MLENTFLLGAAYIILVVDLKHSLTLDGRTALRTAAMDTFR